MQNSNSCSPTGLLPAGCAPCAPQQSFRKLGALCPAFRLRHSARCRFYHVPSHGSASRLFQHLIYVRIFLCESKRESSAGQGDAFFWLSVLTELYQRTTWQGKAIPLFKLLHKETSRRTRFSVVVWRSRTMRLNGAELTRAAKPSGPHVPNLSGLTGVPPCARLSLGGLHKFPFFVSVLALLTFV